MSPAAFPVPGPGAHGGDAASVAAALGLDAAAMIDLSASLNPFAPPVDRLAAAELTRQGTRALTSYPDPRKAAARVAAAIGVDPDLLVLTNGGAEAIALVAQQCGAGAVVDPEFSLYRRHLGRVDPAAPRWRSNPSSPEGCLARPSEVAGVWDEAFYPLATGTWTRGDADTWRLGSLTKLWGCPGLRLGYVIAPEQQAAAAIRAIQPQWAVNGLALALVEPLLERTELASWARQIADLRTLLAADLARLGFNVRMTAANWVLVDHPGLRRSLAPHGVVVRDCASFGLPGVHRVALPVPDRLDEVLAAFAAVARVNGIAAAAGLAIDQLVGEPPARWHPVALFGGLVQRIEPRIYADRRSRGVVLVLTGVGLGVGAGCILRRFVGPFVATVGATAICAAGKMLDGEALRIGELVERGDLDSARTEVRALVGRRADGLDEAGLSRAIVESIAENSVDAVTASLFWASLAGAPGVLAHRAVNTLDAMVGHRDDRYERFGWASARLDDLVNLLPARLTALAVACVRPRAATTVWRVVRRDAPRTRHPTVAWWRRPSPPPSASGWGARTATATSSRIAAPSVTARRPGRATSPRRYGSAAT